MDKIFSKTILKRIPSNRSFIKLALVSLFSALFYMGCNGPKEDPPYISVTGVTLNKDQLALNEGQSEALVHTVIPNTAAVTTVKWFSDRTDVAVVNESGLVTAISVGRATITVVTDNSGKTATCTVTVSKPVRPVEIEMIFVEGGSFTMGCTAEQGDECWGNENPTRLITLSDFHIGKYLVTQEQWLSVMGANPAFFKDGDDYPVEMVSWEDVQEFILNLNKQTGKKYRLPTEAEWEYAARGGKLSKGYKYSGSNVLDDVAWYWENGNSAQPVGTKAPNELGIYDMSGNLFEFCSDFYAFYPSIAETNPTGPSMGYYHVYRGGSWVHTASACRVTYRRNCNPNDRKPYLGFRLALP